MEFKKVLGSKMFKISAVVIGIVLVALVSFAAGMAAGFHKARFSYMWGENYERNFAGPRRGPFDSMPDPRGPDFRNAHGLAGTVISKNDSQLVIKDRDGKENTVAVSDRTSIKLRRDDIKIGDIKENDRVIVLGQPGENGVVNADLVRIFDDNRK